MWSAGLCERHVVLPAQLQGPPELEVGVQGFEGVADEVDVVFVLGVGRIAGIVVGG